MILPLVPSSGRSELFFILKLNLASLAALSLYICVVSGGRRKQRRIESLCVCRRAAVIKSGLAGTKSLTRVVVFHLFRHSPSPR